MNKTEQPSIRPWTDTTHTQNQFTLTREVPEVDYQHALKCVNAMKSIGDLSPEQFVRKAIDDRAKIENIKIEAAKEISEDIDRVDIILNGALGALDPKEGEPNINQVADFIHNAMNIYNKFLPKDNG